MSGRFGEAALRRRCALAPPIGAVLSVGNSNFSGWAEKNQLHVRPMPRANLVRTNLRLFSTLGEHATGFWNLRGNLHVRTVPEGGFLGRHTQLNGNLSRLYGVLNGPARRALFGAPDGPPGPAESDKDHYAGLACAPIFSIALPDKPLFQMASEHFRVHPMSSGAAAK